MNEKANAKAIKHETYLLLYLIRFGKLMAHNAI